MNVAERPGMAMAETTATNLDIARRAEARARADFATWLMMEKLRSIDALPLEAQNFFAGYGKMLASRRNPAEAAETTIRLVYRSYYASMGGTGTPPDLGAVPRTVPPPDNVTPFRKIKRPPPTAPGAEKKRLPVALIFIALAIVFVLFNFARRGL